MFGACEQSRLSAEGDETAGPDDWIAAVEQGEGPASTGCEIELFDVDIGAVGAEAVDEFKYDDVVAEAADCRECWETVGADHNAIGVDVDRGRCFSVLTQGEVAPQDCVVGEKHGQVVDERDVTEARHAMGLHPDVPGAVEVAASGDSGVVDDDHRVVRPNEDLTQRWGWSVAHYVVARGI